LYAVIICLTGLGTLNVKTFTYGRITQSAAQRSYLPRLLSTVESKASADRDETTEGRRDASSSLLAYLRRPVEYRDGSIPLSVF